MRIDHVILGYCEFFVRAELAVCFLNLCHEKGFLYQPVSAKDREDAYCYRCRLAASSALMKGCQEYGIALCGVRFGGLPRLLYRYRRRAGLAVGGALAVLLLWLSCNVVWDVRVQAEGEIGLPYLREQLAACGLSVGEWIPRLETDEVESRLLTTSQGIAWVSVNMRGTVAYVQVRPLLTPDTVDSQGDTVNLVAGGDGIVESVRLMAGDVVVKAGDLVRKGQLLISGVRDVGQDGFALSEARGEVMARTTHTITVEIPLSFEQKVYTGEKKAEKTLFFFGKAIKITKSTGIIGGNCDTIKRLEIYSLWGDAALPISMQTVEMRSFEMQTVTITQQEAKQRAYEQLERELIMATRDATLLSRRVVCRFTSEACVLECSYTCLENIAVPLPFSAEEGERVSQ
ncbi:MAG: sporulation protein YqfD [Clostridia bacterium]|nr:sporulation protein YqfD [Clostridia bacterium]MBR5798031.1 sporulation protein YqfD [Clostridia bacterium]